MSFLYEKTTDLNNKNILSQFEIIPNAKYLDLGCNDGEATLMRAYVIQTKKYMV